MKICIVTSVKNYWTELTTSALVTTLSVVGLPGVSARAIWHD